jgi:hypothetical protein
MRDLADAAAEFLVMHHSVAPAFRIRESKEKLEALLKLLGFEHLLKKHRGQ